MKTKPLFFGLFAVFVFATTFTFFAQASFTPSSLTQSLDDLLNTLPPGTVYGVEVRTANSGKLVYGRNNNNNLLPASILKVPTAIAAYHRLGVGFRYKTSISGRRKPLKGRRYFGDLKLTFSGDPSLTHDDVTFLIEGLKQQGVRDIQGNLWLDNTLYAGYSRAGGTIWDDWSICFAAPASTIILDRNCFYGWLTPAKVTGQRALMSYDNSNWKVSVDNQVITRYPVQNEPQGCVQEVWPSKDYEYRLEGCIAPGQKPMRMAFAVNDVERSAQRYLRAVLKQKGIALKGRVLVGKPAVEFDHDIVIHESEPLPVLLNEMLEKSENIYSDSILKTLGGHVSGLSGSYFTGTESVRQIMKDNGVLLNRSRLIDGSGLSRYNSLSAADMVSMLSVGWHLWGKEAPWLKERDIPEYWLKTGYMSGVNNMTGYIFPAQGETLVFAVILNGLRVEQPASSEEVRAFHKSVRFFHKTLLMHLESNSFHR